MTNNILEMRNIIKEFPGVKALNNVNLQVKKRQIHALVGENGAGKSTLMNVLSGIYPYGAYSGEIVFDGEVCQFKHIKESEGKGIVIIHQELALSPYLTVAENIFLGNERHKKGIINWYDTQEKAKKLMERVGLQIEHDALVKDIGVGHQQLVEIAKALAKDVKLLILDEPTAALNDEDSNSLLELLKELNEKQDITCIIISHKLNEVTKIADEITVIRDGTIVETLVKGKDEISENRIIKGMVGRELTDRYPKRVPNIGEVAFEIEDWMVHDPLDEGRVKIKNVNFNVREGEIVGIAGLMGSGRTELAMSIFGQSYGKSINGKIKKSGEVLLVTSVSQAIQEGLAYLTEDRKNAGLVLDDEIRRNITLAKLKKISNRGVVNLNEEIRVAEEFCKKLRIKASDIYQNTGNLSGGNQQKVIIAKWLFSEPEVLILDEPTRGIDVGAKYEIYTIINDLANQGKCIIVISSELPELLGICDRIYIMNEGEFVGEMPIHEASQESIMRCIIQSSDRKKNEATSRY
ncbi:L-arabinose transport ATP-binding protein AraG [Clostridium aceticum]|uniref:L-arabinose transport ATP-binding protein AraG n=1 Tax=Clostridium aceticum TaxID=84022 RepID=A0A0D8IAU6_9CLOT|nr:multiple monosaccharide ABC transporter ATP-binding protein [Clostridium aceticum]AKL97310.1 L-arabinose transport ATP-binding protein AraG [Clostridium aceticum]KJF26326.1 ABC transporter ATP-binding protein [Clostridium aceticum]